MRSIVNTEEFDDYEAIDETTVNLDEGSARSDQAIQNFAVTIDEETNEFDFDELEAKLQGQLEEEIAGLEFLQEEKDKIGSLDALGETIKNVVWEQFINQVASKAGEDFIRENNGLHLDLRNEAHIQTAENFAEGKIATHNHISRDQLEQNYDRYANTPHKEFRKQYVDPGMDATLRRAGDLHKQGVDTVPDIYTGEQIPTKTKLDNGQNNPDAAQREHVLSSARLYDDPSLQMANTNEELAGIINDPENLQGYTTAERNNRKSDKSLNEIDESDKTERMEKATERAEEFVDQKKKEGEDRLKQEGRKTQREEALRIGGKAARAIVMQLLAELVKEIIDKLVKWFKSAEKKLETLLAALKEAISSFVSKLKTHLINATDTAATVIATAIFGPVVSTIKKVWMMLKQSWQSLKEAVAYIRNPENKGKSVGILMMEVGKIVIAGLSAAGAIVLSEVIEKALIAIPGAGAVFAFEIPLIGSLANILGIFLGAVVAGIVGAIAINLLQKKINEAKKSEIAAAQIDRGNEALRLHRQVRTVNEVKLEHTIAVAETTIQNRHTEAAHLIKNSVARVAENCKEDDEFEETQSNIDDLFAKLKEG